MALNSEAAEVGQGLKSLLVFAPERAERDILTAFQIYLDCLSQSGLFDITVMATNGTSCAAIAREAGLALHPLSDFARKLLQRTPQLWPILTATRRLRFDVALVHEGYACRGLAQIARSVVGVCHDDRFMAYQAADKVITLTSGAYDSAVEALEDIAIEVLPHPYQCMFETIKPLAEEGETLTLGTSGPFIEGDGLGAFIHAAQLLNQSHPDVRFILAGNGPREHELKELADQIAPFIDFVGPMSAKELAEQLDLYCFTAPEAPYSFDLCQMMDAGIACVSTCANGPVDILKGGMVSPLVPIGDTFLLAVQLQGLIEDRPHIERIKKACFERIREEDFSFEVFEERLIALLT